MPNVSAFIVMSPLEAARFRDETANDQHRLDPILVRGGPHQSKYALPARVKTDQDYRQRWDAFNMCDEVALDVDQAFPPIEAARGT